MKLCAQAGVGSKKKVKVKTKLQGYAVTKTKKVKVKLQGYAVNKTKKVKIQNRRKVRKITIAATLNAL